MLPSWSLQRGPRSGEEYLPWISATKKRIPFLGSNVRRQTESSNISMHLSLDFANGSFFEYLYASADTAVTPLYECRAFIHSLSLVINSITGYGHGIPVGRCRSPNSRGFQLFDCQGGHEIATNRGSVRGV
jgi:hypothetical protein